MKNLNRLKLDKTKYYNHISVTHDMTPKERELSNKLYKEAKEKNDVLVDPKNYFFVVRGPPWKMTIKKIFTRKN